MTARAFVDLDALLLILVANSVPVLLSMLLGSRWAAPIDGGRTLADGRPILGAHKTWRGLIAGTAAAGIAGALLSVGFLTGAAFGLLALCGDLLSSFVKRRLGRRSGRDTPLVDQLPEALLPMLVLRQPLGLTPLAILGTAVTFTLLDLLAARIFVARRTPHRS